MDSATNDPIALVETDLVLRAGILVKVFQFKQGQGAPQHTHAHDHISVVATGFVAVSVDGKSTDYGPGDILIIEAGKEHFVRAYTDATWLCIWNEDHYPEAVVQTPEVGA